MQAILADSNYMISKVKVFGSVLPEEIREAWCFLLRRLKCNGTKDMKS